MDQANKPKSSNDDSSRKAFSPRLEELKRALAILYIMKNMSARNKFREKWPDVAAYLFGPELIALDTHGAHLKDYALRSALEERAEELRIDLKTTLGEVEENSVKSGSLLFEYVAGFIDKYGPQISRLVYTENIIERVKPGLLAKADEEKKKKEQEALLAHQQEEDAIRKRAQSLGATNRNRPAAQDVKSVSSVEIPEEVRPIDVLPTNAQPQISADVMPPVEVVPQAPMPESAPLPIELASQQVPENPESDPVSAAALSTPEKGYCKALFNLAASQLSA